MTKEEVIYLSAKDLPNFLGSEIWVQKKPNMISRGNEIVVFGKSFIELVLLDIDYKRNHIVLQGHDGRVEIVALSQCALILACAGSAQVVPDKAPNEAEALIRGEVGLT